MQLERVLPENIDAIWPKISDMVRDACERSHGRFAVEHVKKFALDSAWQIWIVTDEDKIVFVGATEMLVYPTGLKTIAWRLGTGFGRESWQDLAIYGVNAQAKEQGCVRAEGSFRVGWRRIFRNWRHTHEILELDL